MDFSGLQTVGRLSGIWEPLQGCRDQLLLGSCSLLFKEVPNNGSTAASSNQALLAIYICAKQ